MTLVAAVIDRRCHHGDGLRIIRGAAKSRQRRAVRGKRGKPGTAALIAGLETEVLRLERELRSGTRRPGRYVEIEVFVPKHRIVSAAPFRDRIVHQTRDEGRGLHQTGDEDRSFQEAGFHCV